MSASQFFAFNTTYSLVMIFAQEDEVCAASILQHVRSGQSNSLGAITIKDSEGSLSPSDHCEREVLLFWRNRLIHFGSLIGSCSEVERGRCSKETIGIQLGYPG